ncbi:MAG: glycosyltransferase family 4 protein [Hyphomicrobiaceae bacterium]|nr:glycosyltransferase family 4 protein [Hyphomicrobiaceae bacterium]
MSAPVHSTDAAETEAEARPLTVLQVIPALETGGAEQTTLDVAGALVERGHRAIVASAGGRMVAALEAAGARHVRLPLETKNPAKMLANAFALARLARAEGAHILHARSRAPAWSALLAAWLSGARFVTTYHGIYNQKGWLKGLYNSVMARGEAVIANSHYTARVVAGRHPFARNRITVIARGTDFSAFAEGAVSAERMEALRRAWNLPPRQPVILHMARLTRWKGQGVAIRALAALPDKAVKPVLVLAGDAQGRENYAQGLDTLATRLGVGDQVLRVGHCADVPAAFALADVAIVASIEPEAFGRAAVEAQASGTPVVVSDLGAVPETVLAPPEVREEERTGYRVKPGDAGETAQALAALLALDAPAREALTRRARAHVTGAFALKRMTDATLAIYERLAGR